MSDTSSSSMAFAFALCGISFATAASPSAADVAAQRSLQDAVVQLAQQYDAHYRQKDAVGIALLYARDGELVSSTGELIKGHKALTDYYRKRFASGAYRHRIVVIETHAIGDAGYSVSSYSVQTPVTATSDSRLEEGHVAAVYVHDASGWHFALVEPSVTRPKGGVIPLRERSPMRGS